MDDTDVIGANGRSRHFPQGNASSFRSQVWVMSFRLVKFSTYSRAATRSASINSSSELSSTRKWFRASASVTGSSGGAVTRDSIRSPEMRRDREGGGAGVGASRRELHAVDEAKESIDGGV